MPVIKFTNVIVPTAPQDPKELKGWLDSFLVELKDFLDRVNFAIQLFVDGDIKVLKLTEQTSQPLDQDEAVPDGMIAYADGSTWNPGVRSGYPFSDSISYISGTGTAGVDNTAQTIKTLALPADAMRAVGDRIRIRAYWKGSTGGAVTGTIKVGPAASEVTVSNQADAGGTASFMNEVCLEYIDNTHANVMEHEAGNLGAVSAFNVAGFTWNAAQNVLFTQDAIADNHAILFSMTVEIWPKGIAASNEGFYGRVGGAWIRFQ